MSDAEFTDSVKDATTDLTEALADDFPSSGRLENCLEMWDKFGPWIPPIYLIELVRAARKWAELEAAVADGGRVVVEMPCDDCDALIDEHRYNEGGPVFHDPPERRVILGESAE